MLKVVVFVNLLIGIDMLSAQLKKNEVLSDPDIPFIFQRRAWLNF